MDAKTTMSEHPSKQEHTVTEHPSMQEHATMTEHPSTIQDTTTHPSTSDVLEPQTGLSRSSDQGYIVVLDVWEQMLAGGTNFQQLLCWAKRLQGVSVVEPSTGLHSNSSRWGFSFGDRSINLPMLSDVFEVNSFKKQWQPRWGALSTMTSQSKFFWKIKNSKMNAILVKFNYNKINKLCDFGGYNSVVMNELELHPLLTITRKVCINVNPITSDELRDLILGDNEIQNTVIILKDWRGIGSSRVNIKPRVCSMVPRYGVLRPSAQVLEDAKTYADKYLGGFAQYISVTARFEKVPKFYYKISQEKRRQAVLLAINNAMIKVDTLKEKGHIDRVSLSYDYGKLGSRTFLEKDFYNSSDLLVKFQEDLYDGRMSYDDYENSFMTLKWQNAGYIAMVQMTISSKGKCLLQIGPGHCIEFVASLFKEFHPSSSCT